MNENLVTSITPINEIIYNKYTLIPEQLLGDYLITQIMSKVGIWTILAKKPPTLMWTKDN